MKKNKNVIIKSKFGNSYVVTEISDNALHAKLDSNYYQQMIEVAIERQVYEIVQRVISMGFYALYGNKVH